MKHQAVEIQAGSSGSVTVGRSVIRGHVMLGVKSPDGRVSLSRTEAEELIRRLEAQLDAADEDVRRLCRRRRL